MESVEQHKKVVLAEAVNSVPLTDETSLVSFAPVFSLLTETLLATLKPIALIANTNSDADCESTGHIFFGINDGVLSCAANNCFVKIKTDVIAGLSINEPVAIKVTAKELIAGLKAFEPKSVLDVQIIRGQGTNEFSIKFTNSGGDHLMMVGKSESLPLFSSPPTNARVLTINTDEFQIALKVKLTVGFLQNRPEFLSIVLRLHHDGYRAVAGDSSCFFAIERKRSNLVMINKEFDLLLHKLHLLPISRLITLIPSATLLITDWDIDDDLFTRFEIGKYSIELTGNGVAEWPDEGKYLRRESAYRFLCKRTDWVSAMNAVLATETAADKKSHGIAITALLVDTVNSTITVTSGSHVQIKRVIPILSSIIAPKKPPAFEICSLTEYLDDAVRSAKHTEFIQLEFDDDISPVIVRYPANGIANIDDWQLDGDIQEQYTMFFSAFH